MKSGLCWLFDLDNTLHHAGHAIFPAIHRNMQQYMATLLGTPEQPADLHTVERLRDAYYRRYGVTLLGLMRHHQVDPHDFLRAAHHFDDLSGMIRAERGLARLFARLPGKKILLTNAPQAYAREVVRHLRLEKHLAGQISIEAMRVHRNWCPKPSRRYLRAMLKKLKCRAAQTVLVEDTVDNLRAAHSVGMRSVWMQAHVPLVERRGGGWVDVRVRSMRALLRAHGRLRRRV